YTPVQFSPTAPLWLDELPAPGTPFAPDTGPARGGLSPALYGVAAAVRAPGSPGFLVSWAQTRTRGRVRLHAWHLALPGPARVAIAVEPAGPGEHIALITAAHGLTPREGEITGLVLRGHSTAEISRLADLSPYTVQEHLKSVFDKTGVRSRRDLVAALFTRHTEPALLKTATADGVTGRTGLL
ncbi:helix-turn-helix transcriptional regulator, partial [Streptomyces clavuligerus]